MFLPILDNHPCVGKPRFKISGPYPQIPETSFRSMGEPTMKLRREGLLAYLYFMKIHLLNSQAIHRQGDLFPCVESAPFVINCYGH
jgi:hypothetical protein